VCDLETSRIGAPCIYIYIYIYIYDISRLRVKMSPYVTKRTNVQCGCNFLEQPFQYRSFGGFHKWV